MAQKKKNNRSQKKKNSFNFFKAFKPIIKIIENISLILFQIMDFSFTFLFEVFGYVFYGILVFIQTFAKITKLILKYSIYYPIYYAGREITIIFSSLYSGVHYFVEMVFIIFPKYIVEKCTKFVRKTAKNTKSSFDLTKQFFQTFPTKIKDYFVKKYNNLAIVKHYRNKKERELEILYLDKSGKDAERGSEKRAYRYLARNKEGKLIKGYFSALSKLDTHSYLLDEGYEVYEITTSWWINFLHGESRYSKNPMKQKDLIFWLTQLSTYVKSGVPLTDSVKILSQQNKNRSYKKVYDSMIYELTMGQSFSEAMKEQGKVFPPLLVNMVKAAEMIGDLEGTLDEMSDYYQQRLDTKKAMVSALTYPTMIFVFAIAVVAFILIYIIPKFENIYQQMGAEITGVTAFVLNLSRWLEANYLMVMAIIMAVVLIFQLLYKNIKAFRTVVQYTVMHIPVVGKIVIYNEITLFSKTFSSLNKNNVLLTDSMEILREITNNEIYKMIMYDTISNLLRGDKMSLSFKDNWAIPELAYYMITTGESTGELATMLDKVSEYFQGQQKMMANTLKTFIEPITIIVLAVIVGGIILAVIVPMFSLYGSMQM